MEFMRGGGCGGFSSWPLLTFSVVAMVVAVVHRSNVRGGASSPRGNMVRGRSRGRNEGVEAESELGRSRRIAHCRGREGVRFGLADDLRRPAVSFSRSRRGRSEM